MLLLARKAGHHSQQTYGWDETCLETTLFRGAAASASMPLLAGLSVSETPYLFSDSGRCDDWSERAIAAPVQTKNS
jgi:hypothetical protein